MDEKQTPPVFDAKELLATLTDLPGVYRMVDADGKVLLSALKRSGERIELTGKAPIKLHLGFARGAQVTYNGESVDVTPHISGETARLTLGL